MSVLAKLRSNAEQKKKLFGVVAGPRLGGKSTLAGTLPGKTLMLQAAVLESGSESAKQLATKLSNDLTVVTFTSVEELASVVKELLADEEFDNIYVDSLSAITELKDREPAIKAMKKRVVWDAFREIGEATTDIILALKALTYAEKAKKPKNVFLTCALDVKHDKDGNINEVSLAAKGNMAVSAITKVGEAVVTMLPPIRTENGTTGHRMVTKTDGWWPGRIDGVLEENNPGVIEPASLAAILNMIGGA